MKKLTELALVFGIASAIALTTAHAIVPVPSKVTVDEFGNGVYNGVPLATGNPVDLQTSVPGFAYILPFNYTFGAYPTADVELYEPGSTDPITGGYLASDILRYTIAPNPGSSYLFFYSDRSTTDLADSTADVLGLAGGVGYLVAYGLETGLFGNPYSEAGPNGFVYTAGPGMAGWDGNPAGTQYTFISDVPEPSSMMLVGLGTVSLFMFRRREPSASTGCS